MEDTQNEAAAVETPAAETAQGDFVPETPVTDVPVDSQVRQPEFSPLHAAATGQTQGAIGRFYDVDVTVWAELGRVSMPLGQLVRLSEGSVIELGRPVSEPIDLMAQGVRVARGEVVVVDDCFALRIKEIESPTESH